MMAISIKEENMTSIRKTLLSAIIALMTVCSLLFGITLINSNVTARADEELTAADFAVAIAVREADEEHKTAVLGLRSASPNRNLKRLWRAES